MKLDIMNHEPVYRKAPATPGLLIIANIYMDLFVIILQSGQKLIPKADLK